LVPFDEIGKVDDQNLDDSDLEDERKPTVVIKTKPIEQQPQTSNQTTPIENQPAEVVTPTEDLNTPKFAVTEIEKVENWQLRIKIFKYDKEKSRIINLC